MDERHRRERAPWDPPQTDADEHPGWDWPPQDLPPWGETRRSANHPFEPRATTFTPGLAGSEPSIHVTPEATPQGHVPVPPRSFGGRPLAPTPSDDLFGRRVHPAPPDNGRQAASADPDPTMVTASAGLSRLAADGPREVVVRIEVAIVDETARRPLPGPFEPARAASASALSSIGVVLRNLLMATALSGLILAMVVAAAWLLR